LQQLTLSRIRASTKVSASGVASYFWCSSLGILNVLINQEKQGRSCYMPIQNIIFWLCVIGMAAILYTAYHYLQFLEQEEAEEMRFRRLMKERYGNNERF
jgi:hypothetical protein